VSLAGNRERIGPEQDLDHDRGQRVAAEADEEGAGRRTTPRRLPTRSAGSIRFGPSIDPALEPTR